MKNIGKSVNVPCFEMIARQEIVNLGLLWNLQEICRKLLVLKTDNLRNFWPWPNFFVSSKKRVHFFYEASIRPWY